jgi:signal transduction histidine kinase
MERTSGKTALIAQASTPATAPPANSSLLLAAVVLGSTAVFLIDLITPVGLEVWVLYLLVVLTPLLFRQAKHVILGGVLCSVLMFARLLMVEHQQVLQWSLMSRLVGLAVIWLMVFVEVLIINHARRLAEVTARLEEETRQHREMAQTVKSQEERLRKELERDLHENVSREQQRLGQELHDGVGQELTGLGLMANALAERLEGDTTEKQIAQRLVEGLARVHDQVRILSRGLVPVQVEPEGLRVALEDLVNRVRDQSNLTITFEHSKDLLGLDQAKATQLYRIAQEAVSNALRHGKPHQVRITLYEEPGGLQLTVQDDGRGLQEGLHERRGMGFRIMRYRAAQIGATLAVDEPFGGGTAITCLVPRSVIHGSP